MAIKQRTVKARLTLNHSSKYPYPAPIPVSGIQGLWSFPSSMKENSGRPGLGERI